MQIRNLILMLTTMAARAIASEPRNIFIAVHPASVDPFAGVVSIADANPTTLLRVQKIFFTSAGLTQSEALKVSVKLKPAKGILAPNNQISVDDMVTTNARDPVEFLHADKLGSAYGELLTTTPRCLTPLQKVDFVVLDTVLYKNITEFAGVNITFGPNYVNNTNACNPHASQMLSLVVGKNYGVIPNGDRSVYNIGVFNCAGYGFPADIILGINDAIEFASANAQNGRATVVLFSGVRGMNAAVDAATSALELKTSAFIGAGDSGVNACGSNIPPIAAKSFTTGSTTYPGYIPAPFTNYGNPCLDIFLPGVNLKTVNVSDNSTGLLVSGTTYSSAIAAALAGMELGLDPTATPDQVTARILSTPRTEIIKPPIGSFFNQPMTVMTQSNACPYNRIFNQITTNKVNKFNTWYNGTMQNVFCVAVKVNAMKGGILMGLRYDATDPDIVTVTIGKANKPNKHNARYKNSIHQCDNVLDLKVTASNLVKNGKNTILKLVSNNETISVLYDAPTNTNPTPLLFAKLNRSVQEIAFASVDGTANFYNALRCTV